MRGAPGSPAAPDPTACGSGAFLIRAYDAMDAHYKAVVHGLGGAGVPPAELAAIEALPASLLRDAFGGSPPPGDRDGA